MASVCFYFQVHQPYRLRHYTVFDQDSDYFDDYKNAELCKKVAEKCYIPANELFLRLIEKYAGQFKISYSITGILLEQLQTWAPYALDTFKALARTGCVEFLAETYYHSLSFLYSKPEFLAQIKKQCQAIEFFFGQKPKVFRNTELVYNNELARTIESLGLFDGIIAEGVDHILGYRSPNYVYHPAGCDKIKLLLKNYRLSDDIAFRFSNMGWSEYPLLSEKFAHWVNRVNGDGYVVNLFMDYETFGEHQWADTGIFDFLEYLPERILSYSDNSFTTPSLAIKSYHSVGDINVPNLTSWADTERDLSAWLGNAMQANAIEDLYHIEDAVKESNDKSILRDWRKLQTSDHFYYMCTKYFADGDVHKYFNPFDTPHDSYINFMNVLNHLYARCKAATKPKTKQLAGSKN